MNERNLKTYIGAKRTLIVAGPEFEVEQFASADQRIFIHALRDGRLRRYDPEQKEVLEYYIQRKRCSQVMFVGAKHPAVIQRLKEDESIHSASAALTFNLIALLRNKHNSILSDDMYTQMLIELNVINQCKLLLDHFFIRHQIEQKKLVVVGVVEALNNDHFKSVFHNGIVYNDTLGLN